MFNYILKKHLNLIQSQQPIIGYQKESSVLFISGRSYASDVSIVGNDLGIKINCLQIEKIEHFASNDKSTWREYTHVSDVSP